MMMQIFANFHSYKWGAAAWLVLYLCALLLILFRRKSWREGYDLFFWLAVGGLLVIYCPLTFRTLVPGFLPDFSEYERLGWILFVVPVLGFAVTALADEQAARGRKVLFLAVCAVLLFVMGRPNNMQWFSRPETRYKIEQDAVDAAEMIREDADDAYVVVSVQLVSGLNRSDDQDPDYRLFYGMRQYGSPLYLIKCVIPPGTYTDDDFTLEKTLRKSTDYFIGPADADAVSAELDRLGYVRIGEVGQYSIYRHQRHYERRKEAGKEKRP